jgi:putative membrane protein
MGEPAAPSADDRLDGRVLGVAGAISAVALGALAYLLLWPRESAAGVDLRFMPAVNASLNALAATLLVSGYLAIRRGDRRRHQQLMIGAFMASALFLVGYVAYHYVHGDTRYAGVGLARALYLFILATHVLLSMAVLPLALSTFFFAWRGRFSTHRRLAKVTLPLWLYVSVTGVAIFFMLRVGPPAGA